MSTLLNFPARSPGWVWPGLPGDVDRVPVAQLKPLDVLAVYERDVGSVEPPQCELEPLLRADAQPYAVEVVGNTVTGGWGVVLAARAIGADVVAVRTCPGGDGLSTADLGLKAAGWYRALALAGRAVDAFGGVLLAARLYRTWATHMTRRRPSKVGAAVKRARMDLRQALICEAFGRAQRTLERDTSLLFVGDDLRDAARAGRLPMRAVAAAEKLPPAAQTRLAKSLAEQPFAAIEAEFFGPAAARAKTRRGAARAIRKSLHVLVRESRDRADCFGLRPEDYAVAREAIALLTDWVALAPPTATVESRVADLAAEVRGRPNSR
ncbi:unnamed protein product [Gemmataceae bacterium]|nr:unnamed protein product [Gemmataceae bacterium]VTU01425.1 unnamed protein product [Gemmataceae bacterium]